MDLPLRSLFCDFHMCCGAPMTLFKRCIKRRQGVLCGSWWWNVMGGLILISGFC